MYLCLPSDRKPVARHLCSYWGFLKLSSLMLRSLPAWTLWRPHRLWGIERTESFKTRSQCSFALWALCAVAVASQLISLFRAGWVSVTHTVNPDSYRLLRQRVASWVSNLFVWSHVVQVLPWSRRSSVGLWHCQALDVRKRRALAEGAAGPRRQ